MEKTEPNKLCTLNSFPVPSGNTDCNHCKWKMPTWVLLTIVVCLLESSILVKWYRNILLYNNLTRVSEFKELYKKNLLGTWHMLLLQNVSYIT